MSTPIVATLTSGVLVGFVLSLVGGGGSILAVPLLAHFVGVGSPHVAIGTSAIAVAINALTGLVSHARGGVVKWRCAATFALAGVLGAALGALLGKALDGEKLLALFGLLMLVVGALMIRPGRGEGQPEVRLTSSSARVLAPRLIALGFVTGLMSGFFGIGGGFLIVPGLMLATNMPLGIAVSSSLVAVAAFGVTTAASYATSGLVDWPIAALFVAGGVAGGLFGASAARKLAPHKRALSMTFALVVMLVGGYVTGKGLGWL